MDVSGETATSITRLLTCLKRRIKPVILHIHCRENLKTRQLRYS